MSGNTHVTFADKLQLVPSHGMHPSLPHSDVWARLGLGFCVSGFPKLKPNPELGLQAGLGLVGLEPRLYM